MARFWSSGFELNSVTGLVEFTTVTGSPTIVTTPVRSGTYALRVQGGASRFVRYTFHSTGQNGPFYSRIYLRIATLPSAITSIMGFMNSGGSFNSLVRLATDGSLELWDASGKIGSSSSALSLDTWYRIELKHFYNTVSGFGEMEGKLDGTSFASSTGGTAGTVNRLSVGAITNVATVDLYFDDWALNDTTGSFQNSWPGAGNIVHLRPNAAGDNSDWTNDYTNVDEVTPDDGGSLVASNTANHIDDHDIDATPGAIGSSDTIKVVSVGVRFNGAGASANASFVVRVKASSGGTVEESATRTPSDTTWNVNDLNNPRKYPLTLYDLPGASTTVWTKSDLDTAQIGYRLSSASTNNAQISTQWMLVEYDPVAVASIPNKIYQVNQAVNRANTY